MSDETPAWIRVTDRQLQGDDAPALHFDLNRCRRWITFRIHRDGEDGHARLELYETSDGRWFAAPRRGRKTEDGDLEGRLSSAWFVDREFVARSFLSYPDVEPPPHLVPELGRLGATEAPPPEPPAKPEPPTVKPEAPAVNPEPAPSVSPKAPTVDFAALATALRFDGRGKPKQACLVAYMSDKDQAEAEEIAEHVHGEERTTEKGIRSNVVATNASLEAMGSRLRFEMKGSVVRRMVPPE